MKAALIPIILLSSSYVLMPDYRITDDKKPILFEGFYRQAKGAKVKTSPYKHTKIKYSEYDAGLNYTYTINSEHFLNLGLGTYHDTVKWNQNPDFIGKNYDYIVGSLGLVSHGIENWRWTAASVLSFQTQNFGIKQSGWISVLFWGEYYASKKVHLHAGFWGYTGVRNLYFLPVLGFDVKGRHAELSLVFPFDIAARWKPSKNVHLEIAGKWFGGPYRFPQRMHNGIKGYENGIFEIFAPTTELGIYYHPSAHINIGVSGGFTYGGWLLVKDKYNNNPKYYDFASAPYGAAAATFKF